MMQAMPLHATPGSQIWGGGHPSIIYTFFQWSFLLLKHIRGPLGRPRNKLGTIQEPSNASWKASKWVWSIPKALQKASKHPRGLLEGSEGPFDRSWSFSTHLGRKHAWTLGLGRLWRSYSSRHRSFERFDLIQVKICDTFLVRESPRNWIGCTLLTFVRVFKSIIHHWKVHLNQWILLWSCQDHPASQCLETSPDGYLNSSCLVPIYIRVVEQQRWRSGGCLGWRKHLSNRFHDTKMKISKGSYHDRWWWHVENKVSKQSTIKMQS